MKDFDEGFRYAGSGTTCWMLRYDRNVGQAKSQHMDAAGKASYQCEQKDGVGGRARREAERKRDAG